jgi:serine/threonine protein kinase
MQGVRNNEFSTPGCSDITAYHFGREIGKGAYAIVREAIHRQTGEKVAIKQYDRFKLMDIHRKK